MQIYLFPIRVAMLTFPFIAALIVLPVYIYQYRKFGFVNKLRILAIYAFVLYLLCAYFEVILPLPQTRDIISLYGTNRQTYDLTPFSSIKDIIRETQVIPNKPFTYLHLFKEFAFLQVVFNIILTIPFGVFMRYLFNRNFKQTIIFSFLLTLFFELSQLTGLFWIYNAPYRLFQVDDLIFNTMGGMIGYLMTPIFTTFIPTLEKIDRNTVLPSQVSIIRRLAALAVDWIFINILVVPLRLCFKDLFSESSLIFILINLVFIILPTITHGYTLGKKLVRIKLCDNRGKLPFIKLVLRTHLFYFVTIYIRSFTTNISLQFSNDAIIQIGCFFIVSFVHLLIFINFITNLKSHQFFHDKLSGIHNVVVNP